jgi:hypothetical protein
VAWYVDDLGAGVLLLGLLAVAWLTIRFIRFANRPRWRFSVKEVLTAMVVLAAILGLIVYAVRD